MKSHETIRELFKEYGAVIDESLKAILLKQAKLPMYEHMAYFMGFLNEELVAVESYGGKRFRSSLCLMLADWYGCKVQGVSVATSIELFHNFTLIHDDIVDEDELRRKRPTVWKLFGTDHAINSGDGQLVIALQMVVNSEVLSAEQKIRIQAFLTEQYLRVLEGQYLDFVSTAAKIDDSIITEDGYFEMISRKTAALVATATKSAALVSGVSIAEAENLFSFGEKLGIAYQICDDTVSIWGSTDTSGKRVCGDIIEKKKTLPVLYALQKLPEEKASELTHLYNTEEKLTKDEVERVIHLLDTVATYDDMMLRIADYAKLAKNAVMKLSIDNDKKEILYTVIEELLPDIKKLS